MSLKRKFRRSMGAPAAITTKTVDGVRITLSPLLLEWYDALPPEGRAAVKDLHGLAQSDPEAAIPELRRCVELYPDVPVFYNYLSVAHSLLGDQKAAKRVNEECIRRHPDYLFARVNVAMQCLARRDAKGAAAAFDNKLTLRELYPHRDRFHVSEFTAFNGTVGQYHLLRGRRAEAERLYEQLLAIAPDDHHTFRLGSLLNSRSLFSRIFGIR